MLHHNLWTSHGLLKTELGKAKFCSWNSNEIHVALWNDHIPAATLRRTLLLYL